MLLDRLRGYANVFNELSEPFLRDGMRAVIKPGAFRLLNFPITANVFHLDNTADIGTTWDRSLRLWSDTFGLAMELDIPATPAGAGLRSMIASGVNCMSVGLEIIKSSLDYVDGIQCHIVSSADIDHITICGAGAFPSTRCWLASARADQMAPDVAAAARRWGLGRISHDQKQKANREMLDRYLENCGREASARGKASLISVDGMAPMDFLRSSPRARGFRDAWRM